MSNNRLPKKKKQVRDVKSDTVEPAKRQIEIRTGNVSTLTIQLLNAINENLVVLIEEVKNGRLK